MKINKILSCVLAAGLIATSFGATSTNAERKATVPNQKNTKSITIDKKNSSKKENKKKVNKVVLDKNALSEWTGTWNNMTYFHNDEAFMNKYLKNAIRGQAMIRKESYDEALKFFKDRYDSDLAGVIVKGNTISYYDSKQNTADSKEGKLLGKDTYKYVGEIPDGDHVKKKFVAVNKNPLYKFIILTENKKEEGRFPHFHINYGNNGFSELEESFSRPTLVEYNVTAEQYAKRRSLKLSSPTIATFAKNGTIWNSAELAINKPVLDGLWSAKGQLEGKSGADYKAAKLEGYVAPFKSVVFTDTNTVKFYNAADGKGDIISDDAYTFKGYQPTADGKYYLMHFEGTKDGEFKHLLFVPIHNYKEGMVHFHVKYGKTLNEAQSMTKWPTGILPETTDYELIKEYL